MRWLIELHKGFSTIATPVESIIVVNGGDIQKTITGWVDKGYTSDKGYRATKLPVTAPGYPVPLIGTSEPEPTPADGGKRKGK